MPSKGRVRSLCKPLWGISCKPPSHLWPSTTFPLASASQLYLAQAASAKTLFSSASAASNSERACPQVARFGYNLDFLFSPSTNHHFFRDDILSFSRWLLVIIPSWRLHFGNWSRFWVSKELVSEGSLVHLHRVSPGLGICFKARSGDTLYIPAGKENQER